MCYKELVGQHLKKENFILFNVIVKLVLPQKRSVVNLQIEFCHWPVRDILIHMKLNAWQNHSYEIVSSTSTVTGQLDGYLD